MRKRESASGGLSQDRSRRRSTLSNYSLKRLTKTDMVVECLEARPHEVVALPALHSYLQENIHRLAATSLTWVHDIKAACDLELAKSTSRIAELPARLPRGPPVYKLRQHVTAEDLHPPPVFKPFAEVYAPPAAVAEGLRRGTQHNRDKVDTRCGIAASASYAYAYASSTAAYASSTSVASASSAGALCAGVRVRARYSAPLGARWYGGVVEAANEDGTYCIRYDDGDVEGAVLRRGHT